MRRVHAVVSGDVQGVGFRFSTRRRARELGVAGWVRNLPDGSVEAELEGETGSVDRMLAWLDQGPRDARVEQLAVNEVPVKHETGFTIVS